jgi:photosystem II stability/assembly factor-like uncharacterized protein
MNKKLFSILFILGLLSPATIQAQWSVERCPTRNNLNAISLSASRTGWIVGDKGTILFRKNNIWYEYQNITSKNLYSIFMLNENNGWAVGANGTIIHFDGQNWKQVVSPTKKDLFSVYFKDSENGIAVGESGTIISYKNSTWTSFGKSIRGDLFSVFYQNGDAWIGGGLECVKVPIMKMETRTGLTLINNYDSYATIHNIFFLDQYNGWAVGSPSTLLHFDGTIWEKSVIDERFASLKSVFFSDENNGICVGYAGTIMVYSDNRWSKEFSLSNKDLRATVIQDEKYYAVGDSGTILSKKLLIDKKELKSREQGVERIEVYPNPCNQILNVKLIGSSNEATCKFTLTNSTGQVVVQKDLNGWDGNLIFPVITSGLANGVYSLQITSGNKTANTKFIIMH